MGSLSLGVKLGGLGHETSMSKLKQPDNNSNKNRGGQAKGVATFATALLLIKTGGAMGIRTPDPLHAKQVL
jgi:hypothetical protein